MVPRGLCPLPGGGARSLLLVRRRRLVLLARRLLGGLLAAGLAFGLLLLLRRGQALGRVLEAARLLHLAEGAERRLDGREEVVKLEVAQRGQDVVGVQRRAVALLGDVSGTARWRGRGEQGVSSATGWRTMPCGSVRTRACAARREPTGGGGAWPRNTLCLFRCPRVEREDMDSSARCGAAAAAGARTWSKGTG